MRLANPYQQPEKDIEGMVLAHLGLVKRVALHLRPRLASFMELDELVQVGTIGLIEAARSFDLTKGVPFEHFAHSRVRGAIIDEVRR
ncbi:MAG: sigma-70 family RNA polymerase sigma factor, partial [Burkholderiaceae bacterium]